MTRLFFAFVAALFFVGCGGSSDSSTSYARDVLEGHTFYYTDPYLDDPTGYYSDEFGASSAVQKEHAGDGTVLRKDTVSLSYIGNTFRFSNDDGVPISCSIEDKNAYVQLDCQSDDNGVKSNFRIWRTIKDAQANPRMRM